MLVGNGFNGSQPNLNTHGGAHTYGLGDFLAAAPNTYGGALYWGPGNWNYYSVAPGFPNGQDGGPTIRYASVSMSITPEPGTYALMGTVALALFALRRRKTAK
jgi:hypothetical protein